MDDNQTENADLRKSEVIEPEKMNDEELNGIGPDAPGPQVHYKQIFIRQTPNGAEFTKFESGGPDGPEASSSSFILPKPPTLATWICLIAAWFLLSSSLPFTVLIGLPLNIAALVLALVCLTRGGIGTGILVLLLGTVGSVILYLVGLLRFLS